MRDAASPKIALAALALLACGGPAPAPKSLKGTPSHAVDDAPRPRVPKFDVAPPGPIARPRPRLPPEGLADLALTDPSIRLDMRYATPDNFTGAPLPGYLPGTAWLTIAAADALRGVQEDLAADGLGVLVLDAYRPLRATHAMVRWAQVTKNTALLDEGYVARASTHNRGTTVDLTLVELATGKELDMGTPWDMFSEASHFANARGEPMKNRKRLRTAMTKRGFVPYAKEWWHFTHATDPEPPPLDVPYAAD